MKRFGCAINYYIVDLLNIWKDSSPETFAARRDEYLAAANASADSPFCQLDYTRMTKMADFIKRRVDSITCENEMKMEIFFREEQPAFIDDEVNTALFDFSYADRIYAFACEHGLDIRIHTV
ncbi:MAG: endo-1,4-beta-xylanase, partial [Lachnospiraceae bacterium]|nr:endo-1,4-beta-xylanase [Lachnospiraceae bacterium]